MSAAVSAFLPERGGNPRDGGGGLRIGVAQADQGEDQRPPPPGPVAG